LSWPKPLFNFPLDIDRPSHGRPVKTGASRIHGSLGFTPAIAAGIAEHVWSLEELTMSKAQRNIEEAKESLKCARERFDNIPSGNSSRKTINELIRTVASLLAAVEELAGSSPH
jgi:hypothetical protein